MRALGEEWRDLVAGREGFLVDRRRAGLLRHKVVWGDMDTMVCTGPFLCPMFIVLVVVGSEQVVDSKDETERMLIQGSDHRLMSTM